MTSFSSILSSLGGPAKTPQQSSTTQQKPSQSNNNDIRKLTDGANGVRLTPNNVAAGVKRKSEEPEAAPRQKTARSEQDRAANKVPGTASASRFQLSGKGASGSMPARGQQSSTSRPSTSSSQQKTAQHPTPRPASKPGPTSSPTPPSTANGGAPPKRGFASIMERAKAAQEADKAKASSGIKHKPMEKMSRKERLRMMEEAKAEQKGVKRRKQGHSDRSRSGTPATTKAGPAETSFKGTMKKKAEPLAYKGTMRAVGLGEAKEKPRAKGQAQDKYGGYASWSDLDEAEDEEEGYGSDGSSEMDAGWDDVEQEESMALRVARKEDLEALEEEERHRKEKLERKRRLEELSKSAAGKKRY